MAVKPITQVTGSNYPTPLNWPWQPYAGRRNCRPLERVYAEQSYSRVVGGVEELIDKSKEIRPPHFWDWFRTDFEQDLGRHSKTTFAAIAAERVGALACL